jgi:hypothetical protein
MEGGARFQFGLQRREPDNFSCFSPGAFAIGGGWAFDSE